MRKEKDVKIGRQGGLFSHVELQYIVCMNSREKVVESQLLNKTNSALNYEEGAYLWSAEYIWLCNDCV